MPKLSIIIPVYNTEPYLRECLDSIINQTFKDIEIIIVNDCSPDNSESIILEYQAKDPRIKYIKHEKNTFQGGARNTGISHATGIWLAFVDSDDYIDLNTYEEMLSLLDSNPSANLALFSAINFDHNTKKEYYDPYFRADLPLGTIINQDNLLSIDGTVCLKIFKLSDIKDKSILFPEHLKHEDEGFWFKYAASITPCSVSNSKKFYHYRQRTSSTMGQSATSSKDFPKIMLNIYIFLKENGLLDSYQNALLDKTNDAILLYPRISDANIIDFLLDIKQILKELSCSLSSLTRYPLLEIISQVEFINDNTISRLNKVFTRANLLNKWHKLRKLPFKLLLLRIFLFLEKKR